MTQAEKHQLYPAPETLTEPTDHTKKSPSVSLAVLPIGAHKPIKYLIQ